MSERSDLIVMPASSSVPSSRPSLSRCLRAQPRRPGRILLAVYRSLRHAVQPQQPRRLHARATPLDRL